MKFLKTAALAALLAVSYTPLSAQNVTVPLNEPNYNKPRVFSDLPSQMNLRLADMEALLNLSVGAQVNAMAANGFPLIGTVVSKSNPGNTLVKTVVIKSLTRQEATFTFSRITKEDGSLSYTGRMMSKSAGDALEIVKEGAGYVIRKKGFYDLINE
ncbi:MAG: hypothetical protein JWR72_2085 [Flavisolibacter sp.]|jgi:hypothetical protein|nr:hypothetical protein [Flavisolibacter sp.]